MILVTATTIPSNPSNADYCAVLNPSTTQGAKGYMKMTVGQYSTYQLFIDFTNFNTSGSALKCDINAMGVKYHVNLLINSSIFKIDYNCISLLLLS